MEMEEIMNENVVTETVTTKKKEERKERTHKMERVTCRGKKEKA